MTGDARAHTPLTLAIRAVVTGVAGDVHHPIAPEHFTWGAHRSVEPAPGTLTRTVQLEYGVPTRHPASPISITGSYRIDDIPVVLAVTYRLDGGDDLGIPDGGDLASVGTSYLDDYDRLVAALCWPGSLLFSPDGQDTGLMSGMLMKPEAGGITESGSLLIVRHQFRAWVQKTNEGRP